MFVSLPEVDTLIFFFINRDFQNRLFDVIMPFITNNVFLLTIPFIAWLCYKDRKKACLALILGLASFALADWISHFLKHVFERPRPCNILEGVHLLAGCSRSYSMPSSHAANSFAFVAPFVILYKNNIRYAFLLIAFVVSFSRIYIGVHYPSIPLFSTYGIIFTIDSPFIFFWILFLFLFHRATFNEKPKTRNREHKSPITFRQSPHPISFKSPLTPLC